MVPTRLTQGILIAGIVLTAYSIFFDSKIAMIAVVAIVLTFQWRLFLYHKKVTEILSGVECHRSLSSALVRQGRPLTVSLEIKISMPEGFSGLIRDQVPVGMILSGAPPEAGIAGTTPRKFRLQYTVTPLLHGSSVFPGLVISLQDRFFSDTLRLQTKKFSGPMVRVFPVGKFEPVSSPREFGEHEIEKIRAISGLGIHGFRDFVQGDDPKSIDWKLTAKFDRYMIREYTGQVGTESLMVADLPDVDDEVPGDNFQKMMQALSGWAEQSLRQHHRISLALITGPNVVRTEQYGNNQEEVMNIFQITANPVKRLHTFYRYKTRGEIGALIREISRQEAVIRDQTDERNYLTTLSAISTSLLDDHESLAFQGEISRFLRMTPYRDVIIFSLGSGDMSHIRFFIDEIHREHGSAHLNVPGGTGRQASLQHCLSLGADSVKVF